MYDILVLRSLQDLTFSLIPFHPCHQDPARTRMRTSVENVLVVLLVWMLIVVSMLVVNVQVILMLTSPRVLDVMV